MKFTKLEILLASSLLDLSAFGQAEISIKFSHVVSENTPKDKGAGMFRNPAA